MDKLALPRCRITLTGADDEVNQGWMIEMSDQYPDLEWGILFSHNAGLEGVPRYPSKNWRRRLYHCIKSMDVAKPNLAAHVCGAFAESFLEGWRHQITEVEEHYNRVQFNRLNESTSGRALWYCRVLNGSSGEPGAEMAYLPGMILQYNPGTKAIIDSVPEMYRAGTYLLHDCSGGRGVKLDLNNLPDPVPGYHNAYAGGIDEGNVVPVIQEVSKKNKDVYVDLESGVRENNKFSYSKAERIVELATTEFSRIKSEYLANLKV